MASADPDTRTAPAESVSWVSKVSRRPLMRDTVTEASIGSDTWRVWRKAGTRSCGEGCSTQR